MLQWAQGYVYLFKLVFFIFFRWIPRSRIVHHTCFRYFYFFHNLLTIVFLKYQLSWIWELTINSPTHIGDLPDCINFRWMGSLSLFSLQCLMVASSKHHVSHKVDDSRVVSRSRSTNMNNGTEESIISYCRWWLQRETIPCKNSTD